MQSTRQIGLDYTVAIRFDIPSSVLPLLHVRYETAMKIILFGNLTDPVEKVIGEETTVKQLCFLTGQQGVTAQVIKNERQVELRNTMKALQHLRPNQHLLLSGKDFQQWAVYTVDFYEEEVQRVKKALQDNWAPMFPGEALDSEEDTELFKALIAKLLSPSEVSVDPALNQAFDVAKLAPPNQGNGQNPDLDADLSKPTYVVPKVTYSESNKLKDKKTWSMTCEKAVLPDDLHGKERGLARRQINRVENVSYVRQSKGKFYFAQDLAAEDLRMSSTGWMGLSFPVVPGKLIVKEWENGEILKRLKGFKKVPYCPEYTGGTFITDSATRSLIFRSYIGNGPTYELHSEFVEDAAEFVRRCSPHKDSEMEANKRGPHWFCIAGYDRQNKDEIALRDFHTSNAHVIEEFFDKGKGGKNGRKARVFWRITGLVNRLVRMHFPKIARRYEENVKDINEKTGGKIKPHFGLFWNFCLNSAYEDTSRVHCYPHIDSKNIAIGVCALYIYGNFDSKELSWLCIWEAGVIIELPPGVILIYPSALFYHFNVDMCDLDIRTTSDGQQPAPSSPKLAQSGAGRGSCVWFNQASMFQVAKIPYKTLKEARRKQPGKDFNSNNKELLDSDYFPGILALENLYVQEE